MVTFQFAWAFAWEVFLVCLKRVPVCFFAATAAMLTGLVFGIPLAAARQGGRTGKKGMPGWHRKQCFALLANAYVHLIRGVPTILLLLILYLSIRNGFNALAAKFQWQVKATVIPALGIAVLALGLSTAAFLSGSFLTALRAVSPGQREAGLSIGMTEGEIFRRIILPQAFPVALPLIGNQYISMLRATSLIGYIGVVDIVQAGKIKATLSSNNMEAYLAEVLIYWGMTVLLERLFGWLSGRAGRKNGLEAVG